MNSSMPIILNLFCLLVMVGSLFFQSVHGFSNNLPTPGPDGSHISFYQACVVCTHTGNNFRANIKIHDNRCVTKDYLYGQMDDVVIVTDEKKCDVFLVTHTNNLTTTTTTPPPPSAVTGVPANGRKGSGPSIPKNGQCGGSVNGAGATTIAVLEGLIIIGGLVAFFVYFRRERLAKNNFTKFGNDNLGFANNTRDGDEKIDLNPMS